MKTKNETGHPSYVNGTYRCAECTMIEREIEDGHLLPVCPYCHTAVTWLLVSQTPVGTR